MNDTISTKTLKELVQAGSIRSALLIGTKDGFVLRVRYGIIERTVEAVRGHVRVFAALDSAASFLKRIGIHRFEVDAIDWTPPTRQAK